ncbi:MAG: hypothetical protein IKI57_01520 [Clostridia bacterium]|nr:hypothetical protein [Clostridia bacterium]
MAYIDSRSEELREIHSVYSHDISDFICNMADLPDLQRISNISKCGGVELSNFNLFQYRYSRLDHSFGVAIILENFKQGEKHILEGLMHEMAEPSFAWSVDYLIDYFKLKDYRKTTLFDKIVGSTTSYRDVINGNYSIEEISYYKDYDLGFADFPKLSAENLEIVLSNSYFSKLYDLRDIEAFYNNLTICKNEDNKEEFCFTDINLAYDFFRLSIEIGKRNRSYEAKITRQLISDVLMLMIRREEIKLDDLFNFTDKAIVGIGKSCSDKRIKEGWAEIEGLDKVFLKFNDTNDKTKYCVKVESESFYIDPLIKTKAGVYRLSNLSERVEKEIEAYLSTDTDMYMCIDYEL